MAGDATPSDKGGRSRGGSRSTSANHLLNFQSYSGSGRGGHAGKAAAGRRGSSQAGARHPRGQNASRPQRYDKNQFLQANFRFLVSDAVEEARFHADPDLMFDWEDVVQVEMMTTHPVQCSISLDSPPICPQITPCGHVFSFASIMQHLVNHGGKNLRCSAPCPLCFSPIVARELRLVRMRPVGTAKVGDTPVLFQLLKRSRASIVPEPVTRLAAAAAAAGVPSGGSLGGAAQLPEGLLQGPPALAAAAAGSSGCTAAAVADGLSSNVFAKFAVVGDATPLWREAARELAAYAAEVTSEGGLEAAYTAPFIYSALDSLAARARKWTLRRAETLASRGLLPGAQEGDDEKMGAEAEAVVKSMFTAGVCDAKEALSVSAVQAEQEQQFPALPTPARPAAASQRQPKQQEGQQSAMGGEFGFEAAFWDEEGAPESPGTGHQPPTQFLGFAEPDSAAAQAAKRFAAAETSADGSADLMGTSPNTTMMNAPNQRDEYYMYQAADGTWVFLHPLNLRCLLHHYGTYEACPTTLSASILELEDVVQSDITRKRWRFLAHLPTTGTFKLAEVSLTGLLPSESLAPFADELSQRERRRRRRIADDRREQQREAAEARAAEAARRGPSERELRAMPLPSASLAVGTAAVAAAAAGPSGSSSSAGGSSPIDSALQMAIQASLQDPMAASPPGNVGWAHLVKMGYAATGPTLGSSPPSGSGLVGPQPSGAWGAKKGSIAAAAAAAVPKPTTTFLPPGGSWAPAGVSSSSSAAAGAPAVAAGGSGGGSLAARLAALNSPSTSRATGPDADGGSKGKTKKGTLLFTTAQRKY